MDTVTITTDHLALLERMEFDWDDAIEFGAVCSDSKRPYGNSGVPQDVAEILGAERCRELWGSDEPSWQEAQLVTAEVAALLNAMVKQGLAAEALLGAVVPLPWRARQMKGRRS